MLNIGPEMDLGYITELPSLDAMSVAASPYLNEIECVFVQNISVIIWSIGFCP